MVSKMADAKLSKKLSDEIENALTKCSQCGKCRSICPTFEYKKVESYNERGRLMLYNAWNVNEIDADGSFIDRVYTCLLCRVCEEVCPPKVRYMDIAQAVRGRLAEEGKGPLPEQRQVVETVKTIGNIFAEERKLSEIPELTKYFNENPENPDYLFFIGCMASRKYPNFAVNAIEILRSAGLKIALDENEKCCNGVAFLQGMNKDFEEVAEQNMARIKEFNTNNILTVCPMCYSALKKEYKWDKDVNVVHATEVYAKLVKEGKLKFERKVDKKVVFFDSCHLGRWGGIYEEPRIVLKAIPGLELLEIERNRNLSRCCGGPIRVPYIDFRNEISQRTLEEVEDAGADYLVTTCGTCYYNLQTVATMWEMDLTVLDIGELLAYAMGLIDDIPQYEI